MAAAAAWDVEGLEVKHQSREIDAQTRSLFGLSASALTSVSSVRAVMVRAPAMQVSPISGNDTIQGAHLLHGSSLLLLENGLSPSLCLWLWA